MDADLQLAMVAAKSSLSTLKSQHDHYKSLIKRRLVCGEYRFSQYYANSFRIMRDGAGAVCNITHFYREPGETVDGDGDPIPPEPYRVAVDSRCSGCNTPRETIYMLNTIEEVMRVIAKAMPYTAPVITAASTKKRTLDDDIQYDQFCAGIAESVEAVCRAEEIYRAMIPLRRYIP